jgi:FAD/FMN-containing dehydrogenase
MDKDKVYKIVSAELGKACLKDEAGSLIVQAESERQIIETLKLSSAHRLRVRPRGLGAWLGGYYPGEPDLYLDLARHQGIENHDKDNLCLEVKAGTTIADLNAKLAAQGQCLGVDPPRKKVTSVGGMLALDLGGPRRLAYGETRDQLLGLRLVTGDGRAVSMGGKVVKNVSSYDLTRAFPGSRGRWAVLTSAAFKLRPLAETAASYLVHNKNLSELVDLSSRLAAGTLEPQALAIVNQPRAQGFPIAVGRGEWVLACELAGNRESVAKKRQELLKLAPRAEEAPELIWQEIEDFPVLAGGRWVVKLFVRASEMAGAVETIWQEEAELYLDPAGGVVYGAWPSEPAGQLRQALARTGTRHEWICPVSDDDPAGYEAGMRGVFDPVGILSPESKGAEKVSEG